MSFVRSIASNFRSFSSYVKKDLPKSFSWRNQGVLTETRQQEDCDCCWAHTACKAVEAGLRIHCKISVTLSRTELIECCNNPLGELKVAFKYMTRHGITEEKYYRKFNNENRNRIYIDGCTKINSETKLMKIVYKQPVGIAVCAGDEFDAYEKGIFDKNMCHEGRFEMGEDPNHAVLLVGFGTRRGNEFWEIQNSWSKEWGDNGFMLLKRNKTGRRYGQCNLLKQAYVPNIRMNPWDPPCKTGQRRFDGAPAAGCKPSLKNRPKNSGNTGAKILVTRDMDADPNSSMRMVELMGTPDAVSSAEKLINEVLAEAEVGASGGGTRRMAAQSGGDEFVMQIPNNKVGRIIGNGGETIKSMQLVNQILTGENRLRNSGNSGGYTQQGYQSRPPSSWAPPAAPVQQPGYGYVQPGSYSGPSPQYNMPQPPYTGYPPQQAGGYSANWDQSTAPSYQQSTHASGYDYYNQQPQQQQNPGGPAQPADGSTYNYSQPPSSGYTQPGQGYGQESYGAYNAQQQSGYAQQPPTYEQQQGYGSAPSYGSRSNPTQEGHTSNYGSQGDSIQTSQPSTVPQQGYATYQQGTPRPGYGVAPRGLCKSTTVWLWCPSISKAKWKSTCLWPITVT